MHRIVIYSASNDLCLLPFSLTTCMSALRGFSMSSTGEKRYLCMHGTKVSAFHSYQDCFCARLKFPVPLSNAKGGRGGLRQKQEELQWYEILSLTHTHTRHDTTHPSCHFHLRWNTTQFVTLLCTFIIYLDVITDRKPFFLHLHVKLHLSNISPSSDYLPPLEQQKGWHYLGKEIATS